MSVTAPEPDPRGRPLIYAVAPESEVDRTSSIRRWPILLRRLLATLAMMTVALGGGATAIWLVMAPVMPAGAATARFQQRPSQLAPTQPAGSSTEPTTAAETPATTPPTADQAAWLQPPIFAKQEGDAKHVVTRARKCS